MKLEICNFKLGLISKPKKISKMQINKILKDNGNVIQIYSQHYYFYYYYYFIYLLLFSLLSTRLFLWLESTFCECDLYKITFRYLYPDGNIENPTKT